MTRVDFSEIVRDQQTFIFSGKDKGIETRKYFGLDDADNGKEVVDVVIPEQIKYMTPSFVTGMFSSSVKRAGTLDAFFGKYRFHAHSAIVSQITEGAKLGLVRGNALSDIR